MKTIIGLTIAFILAVGMIGVATFAYFSDTETSAGNQLTAGTLDLKTDDADGVSETLYATNMAPGDTVGPSTIQLKNSGSVDGSSLDIEFSYVESDGSPNSVDKSANDTAAMMEVTTLDYGGSDLLGSVSDSNGNGYEDIEDLENEDLSGQSGIDASATENFEIAVQLRSETGDDFQADGITLTMTFTLNQCGSSYAWYDTNWQYRRQITIDHTKVENVANPSTTYADFPVLVYATGLSNIKANGADIRFTSSDGTTELPREIESYSGGTLWAWVKVTLTKDAGDSTDDVIYMYYGNDSASEPAPGSAYGAENVWDSDYKGVWHLRETSGTQYDSTSNDNDASATAAVNQDAAGVIDGADHVSGVSDTEQITVLDDGSLDLTTQTVSMWFKQERSDADISYDRLISKKTTWDNLDGWSIELNGANSDGSGMLGVLGSGSSFTRVACLTAWDTAWHHLVVTFQGTSAVVYFDGVNEGTSTIDALVVNAVDLMIGWQTGEAGILGIIDEVRISNTARSADWIETCYNNQDSPSSFCSVGAEE